MQHDIYSLGVVLLEIGLWESFINYLPQSRPSSASDDPNITPEAGSSSLDENKPIQPSFIAEHGGEKDTRKHATAIKTHLISLAVDKLPARMGNKYTDIVLLCLRCLDRRGTGNSGQMDSIEGSREEEDQFDADMFDDDGIVVGVRYIEKILLKIQEISI